MIVILHRVTPKNEDGSEEAVVTTMKSIEEDIKALVRCDLWVVVWDGYWWYNSTLGTINQDLTEISLQKRWAIAIYKELNANKLEDCIRRLSTALERFKVHTSLVYRDVQ